MEEFLQVLKEEIARFKDETESLLHRVTQRLTETPLPHKGIFVLEDVADPHHRTYGNEWKKTSHFQVGEIFHYAGHMVRKIYTGDFNTAQSMTEVAVDGGYVRNP